MQAPTNRKFLFSLTFLYVSVPLLVYVWRNRLIAPVYLFADDAYYYLDIARNSLGRAGYTFDGQHVTNGFHPLWQWTLVALGKLGVVHYADLNGTLLRVYVVNVLLLAVAAGVFCAACARYLRPSMLAILSVAPGVFWVLFAGVTPIYFSTWYYANGMESAMALLFFSLALLFFDNENESVTRLVLVAICLGLAVLARLDDVFLVLAIAGWILLSAAPEARVRKAFALSPIAIFVLAYMFYNRATVGVFLPLSGAAKAGLALTSNVKWTLRMFVPIFSNDQPGLTAGPRLYVESTVRQIQMIFPAIFCAAELLYLRFRKGTSSGGVTILHAAAVGVLVKAFYNYCFVESFDQGLWYYTVSIAVANFILVLWIARAMVCVWPDALANARLQLRFLAGHMVAMLFVLTMIFSTRNLVGSTEHMTALSHVAEIRAKLQSLHADKLVELDDGFVGYISQGSSVGGLGLVLDKEASQALKQGDFLDVMYSRGYRVLVGEAYYGKAAVDVAEVRAQGQPAGLFKIAASEFESYRLVPVAGDAFDDGLYYFRIEPVRAQPAP